MKLQTKILLAPQTKNQIDYHSNVLLIGSCFSDNIGKKLEYFKFQNLQNPFGILFHPKAIEKLISNAINKKEYSEKDIFFHNEQWHCFDAHSKLSNTSKEVLLKQLNKQTDLTTEQLNKASHIIITLGTAWVYRDIETNNIVANCHKIPQKQFEKELLSVEEIYQSLKNIVDLITSVDPSTAIIFTVSPVRHLKDGFIENNLSKSHLITAIHKLIPPLGVRGLLYFPSYEIMMDELRDYRFYNEDMLHPNETAIHYIWGRFKNVWISKNAFENMEEVDSVQKGLQHKPFNPNSEAHLKFLEKLEAKIKRLQSQFSHISF